MVHKVTVRALVLFSAAMLLAAGCAPRTGAPARAVPQEGASAPSMKAVEDFYRGKTITIVVGFAAGGGFDATARILANYLGRYIPGEPDVIVQNMDGAGSLIAANHLYNVAKPDGLTIGTFNEVQLLNQVLGVEGVQFDARNFGWVGNAILNTTACTIRSDSPYQTAQDLRRKDLPPLIVGGTAPGANTDDFPKLLNLTLGMNFRVVSGYAGSAPIRLATDAGEVQGMCWSYESLLSTGRHWVETDFIRLPLYQSAERNSKLEEQYPYAVRAEDLTDDPQAKRLLRAQTAANAISKPFVAPPGVPPERLKALQDGFWAAMQDPALLAQAEKARLDFDPKPAAKTEGIVKELLSLPPDLVEKLKEVQK